MDTENITRELDVWIDDFTPCLKDTLTGEVVTTEVIRIRRKSFLSKFNRKSGWYVNWGKIVEDYEVYALVLEGTVDIQGLVALKRNDELKAMYIAHYIEKMNATHVGILHPYQFCVFEDEMQKIIKTYTYAYSGEEI